MPVLPIRTYGDPCLKVISAPVDGIDDNIKQLISDMTDTLYQESHHIGLAAPQVGVNTRLFLIDIDWIDDGPDGQAAQRNLQIFINPEIIWESEEDDHMSEGCLSLPGIEGEVYRPLGVKMRYLDENGLEHERSVEGLEARCILHELDHLDGKLFIDRMPFMRRQLLAGKLSALKRKQMETAAK